MHTVILLYLYIACNKPSKSPTTTYISANYQNPFWIINLYMFFYITVSIEILINKNIMY
jgi:hypothetical protein